MRFSIIATTLLLAGGSAMAQTPAQPTPPGQKALEIMLSRETAAHQADLGAALQFADQVDALKKQVVDLTKELAEVKAAPATPVDAPK